MSLNLSRRENDDEHGVGVACTLLADKRQDACWLGVILREVRVTRTWPYIALAQWP